MKTLYIQLSPTQTADPESGATVELLYSFNRSHCSESRQLPFSDIEDLANQAGWESDRIIADPRELGQKLYNWLDGSDKWLTHAIAAHAHEDLILAISTPVEPRFIGFGDRINTTAVAQISSSCTASISHLPWEMLHDERGFLIKRIDPYVVPVRWWPIQGVTEGIFKPKRRINRPLQVLVMTTAADNRTRVGFKFDRLRTIEAIAQQPLTLEVEESGCVEKLAQCMAQFDEDYFDVFHLMGQATMTEHGDRFLTQTDSGETFYASTQDMAKSFPLRFPTLFFLQGYSTADAPADGVMSSLAREFLTLGAQAVVSWEPAIADSNATEAIATFYKALSAGNQVTQALALTYQSLIQNQVRDWHRLQLYVADRVPEL